MPVAEEVAVPALEERADSERRKGGGYGRWRGGCWPAAERDEQICGGQWEEDEM